MSGIFNKLFSRSPQPFSKNDYWKHWEFFELLDDLKIIESTFHKLYGKDEFDQSVEGDTHAKLIGAIDDIEFGNRNDLFEIDELFQAESELLGILQDQNTDEIANVRRRVNNWKEHQ
jgi:hypothetical protein